MSRIDIRTWLVAAAGLLAGCQPTDGSRPPTVRFGEEACGSCHMIISDERYAAALVTPGGDALKFDDIGCLIEHEAGQIHPDTTYWVRDSGGGRWLNAREATFVHSPRVASPMGFGLAARPAGRAADRPADAPGARMLSFQDLPGFLADRSREPGPGGPKAEANGGVTGALPPDRSPGGADPVRHPPPQG